MPLDDEFRFWCGGGDISIPRGPSDWIIVDFDQRRIIVARMDGDQDSEELALGYLKRYIDTLDPDVTFVYLSPDGGLVKASTDLKHDKVDCVYYPPLSLIRASESVQTVVRTELRELDRLGADIDLVSYQTCIEPVSTRKAVFKYYWHARFVGTFWKEAEIWMRLPPHPNIVPFDRLVLDEMHGNVVGFTSLYIPGGTLDKNPSRVFKLKWLQQLTQVIDDLNLRHGIWHQDVAARNLVVDAATDNIMIFDFNVSARVGYINAYGTCEHIAVRDDVMAVVFTLYELITHDLHFRENTSWDELSIALVQDIEWVPHPDVKLDHPVAEYRALLDAWVKERKEGKKVEVYTDAPEYLDWKELEQPLVEMDRWDEPPEMVPSWVFCRRTKARAEGREVLDWQRPVQSTLGSDCHLLATGKLLEPAAA